MSVNTETAVPDSTLVNGSLGGIIYVYESLATSSEAVADPIISFLTISDGIEVVGVPVNRFNQFDYRQHCT